MKRTVIFLLALLVSVTAFSQDKLIFNHFAIAPSIGDDGLGVELAAPLTPYVTVKAGYSFVPYAYNATFGKFGISDFKSGDKTYAISSAPLDVQIMNGGRGNLMFDIFPGKKTPFHFTVGAFFGSGNLLHAKADMSGVLDKADWGTLSLGYNDLKISTDNAGQAYADLKTAVVLPYVGIGFGHPINRKKLVSVTFDMGVSYTGGMKLASYNYLRNEAGDIVYIHSSDLKDDSGKQMDNGIVDSLAKFPILPILKLNVFFNLF